MKNRIIGGDFEIDPALLMAGASAGFSGKFSSGRAALAAILAHLDDQGVTSLLLPDYLCESLVWTARNSGYKAGHYDLGKDLRLDRNRWNRVEGAHAAVLLINYFGLLDLSDDIRWLKRAGFTVIVDNVHSFFSMNLDSEADYQFSSFRKIFPVPDGARVISRASVEWDSFLGPRNQFYPSKIAGGILKHLRNALEVKDEEYLDLFAKGEAVLNAEIGATSASILSSMIMAKLEMTQIAQARIRNAQHIVQHLNNYLGDFVKMIGSVPLCIPLLLNNRDEVRTQLRRKSIFLPVHWPCCDEWSRSEGLGKWMSEHELSIVIDQRYTVADMDFILEALNEASPEFIKEITVD
jgi:hypothetical protein